MQIEKINCEKFLKFLKFFLGISHISFLKKNEIKKKLLKKKN